MKRIKTLAAVVLGAAALCWSATASAAPENKRHDGLHFQLQAGLGFLSSTAKADVPGFGEMKFTYKGMSLDTALLLGGSPIPGLAIGGMILTDFAPSPSVSQDGESAELEDVNLYLIGLGPYVDFYPDPYGGLHFQVMAGWGGLEATYQGDAGGSDPTGLVMSLGGGYDWWVGNGTAIGVMGRLGYAPLKRDDVKFNTISPAILATFTFQ